MTAARRAVTRLLAAVRHAFRARRDRVTADTWEPHDIDRW